jgi:mono/diheme cytochrome c family protein
MRRLPILLLVACVCSAVAVAAEPTPSNARGELLYSTHCVSCHTTQVHWRDKRLATDWARLRMQVNRWQGNTGLGWSDDDITAVTRYLNDLFYRFSAPDGRAALQQPSLRVSIR